MNFDLQLARYLADRAANAYHTTSADQTIIAGTGALAEISFYGDCTVLAFKGTSTIRDWLVDLDVLKEPLANGVRIHAGFMRDADCILPLIISKLLPAGADKSKLKPIILTGHSLGGALATLVAFFLQREGFNIQAVYTFGSPRVGNGGFRDAYTIPLGAKTFRVVCAGDLVPLVPGLFTTPMDGYRHVGTEVYLNGMIYIAPSRLIEIALDAWRVFWAIRRADYDFVVQFHSITSNYLQQLSASNLVSGLPHFPDL